MSCMAKIEDAVSPVDGVRETDVDITTKRVRVTFDAATAPDQIAAAITSAGYGVAAVSE